MLAKSESDASPQVARRPRQRLRRGGVKLVCVSDLGKVLILAGAVAIVAGFALMLLGRANIPLGRLPGDIVYRGKNTTFYFPLATSILVSVVLSVALYLIGRFRR
jgi:hypothetical protein